MTPIGPFDSEREARAAAHAAVDYLKGTDLSANKELLSRTIGAAGVKIGAFDAKIINWLAGWPDTYAAVITGLIERAYEAGKREGKAR